MLGCSASADCGLALLQLEGVLTCGLRTVLLFGAMLCRFTQRQEARAGAVAAEYQSLQQQLEQLHMAAAELGSSARLSEAQQQLGAMESTLEAADREHAARVASILKKLQVSTQRTTTAVPTAGRCQVNPSAVLSLGNQVLPRCGSCWQPWWWCPLTSAPMLQRLFAMSLPSGTVQHMLCVCCVCAAMSCV